jgi:DNA-binding MarR family transcriptional regulator
MKSVFLGNVACEVADMPLISKFNESRNTMKSSTINSSGTSKVDANRLADFVLMTQRSCILNLSSELNRGNISFPQFFLLTYLSNEDYLTMSAIAKKMGHSTAAATGLVDRLEKLNFVERVHAAEDRRKIMVRITNGGTEIVATMRGHIATELADLMADMDDEDTSSVAAANEAIKGKNLNS